MLVSSLAKQLSLSTLGWVLTPGTKEGVDLAAVPLHSGMGADKEGIDSLLKMVYKRSRVGVLQ